MRRPPQYSEWMRLDEDKLDALRRWGQGLRQADAEEYAAAGRAILMLIDELERLRLELRRAREQLSRVPSVSSSEAAEGMAEPVASTLHERLQQVLTRDSDPPPETRPEPVGEAASMTEGDDATTSPQAWIESLRQQN